MKKRKLALTGLKVASFTTTQVKELKGGWASQYYSDCCSGVDTCDGNCDEPEVSFWSHCSSD